MGGGKGKTSGKVRFDGVDVAAMVSHLKRTMMGRRVINIYDGVSEGADSYLFKFDGSEGKIVLFLESGIRFHTTVHQASLQQERMPSPFCSKLRKHLRGLRLERAVQLGKLDRVVELTFGSGGARHSLIIELYARGNILLTNKEYEIMALLRSHEYADQNIQVRVGNVYPVTYATSLGQTVQGKAEDNENGESTQPNGILGLDGSAAQQWASSELTPKAEATSGPEEAVGTSKKAKGGRSGKKGSDSIPLKALLLKPTSGVHHYGPSLIEHCILFAHLDPNLKISESNLPETIPISDWDTLVLALREEGSKVLGNLSSEETGGYILYRPRLPAHEDTAAEKSPSNSAMQHADKVLEEFQPHLLKQHEGRPFIQYDTYAEAVDDFFFHIGGQKRALRAESAEAVAREKLIKVRKDLEGRVETLQREQEQFKEHADLVKYHAEDVDKALGVINSALDTGMDWEALEQLVEVEQKNSNPIALLIKRLDLEGDSMVLSLPNTLSDGTKPVEISVSLKESAYGNVRDLYDKYRAAKQKSEKTLEATTKALKAAEATAQRQLEEVQKKAKTAAVQAPARKSHWFEKFHWFITSDNYLVLGGRDAQQNELLVKRYLRPGDAYLHADVHGAASCVLRAKRWRTGSGGKTNVVPLSDQALREAGNFTICLSSAWSSRMVTSAWWVEPSQVSKTAPTGEYLTVGSFMIRGKKNFLPPSQLEMGLAVLFRLGDDESIVRHKNERRDFALLSEDADAYDEDQEDIIYRKTAKKSVSPAENNSIVPALREDIASDKSPGEVGQVAGINASEFDRENDPVSGSHCEESTEGENGGDGSIEPESAEGLGELSADTPLETNVDVNDTGTLGEKAKKKKKGLSVRDRKLIKKYGSLEAAEKAAKEREENAQEKQVKKDAPADDVPTVSSAHKRGKKSKLKRAAKKYDEQDDEDRELAMLALHGGEKMEKKRNGKRNSVATSVSQKKASAEAAALLVKDAAKVSEELPNTVRDVLASCVSVKAPDNDEVEVRWEKFDADVLELLVALDSEEKQLAVANRLLYLKQSTRVDNFSASLAGILRTIQKYGHEQLENSITDATAATSGARRKTKGEKEREKEEWREVLAEEGIVEEDAEEGEEMVDDTMEISKLTGKPHPDDSLLYAVPVCAPYQTLSKYKYKVKLTPGAQKRGKASKQCMEMFLRMDSDGSPSVEWHRELVKRVGDNDWVQTICPNVKISAPGASKAGKKQKPGRKKGGKRK